MPPAVSDDDMDSDGPDMVPAKGKIPTKAEEVEDQEEEEDDDDDDDEDEDGEEYRVEKILTHEFDDGNNAIYQIKWLGYDSRNDLTWEPLENLDNAMDIVDKYHKSIGGAPQPTSKKGGKGKRSASSAFKDSPAVESKKRGRKSAGDAERPRAFPGFTPPEGEWDSHVKKVTSIIEEQDMKPNGNGKGSKTLYGLLEWNKGQKTSHPLSSLRTKCPQALLDYYEKHLVFKTGGDEEL